MNISEIFSVETTIVRRGPWTISFFFLFGFFIGITAILGNIAVIAVSVLDEALSSNISTLLTINLAVADLTTALIMVIPGLTCLVADKWIFGDIMCRAQGDLYYVCVIVSIWTLAFVSIDRGIAILRPFHYGQIVTRFRMSVAIVWTWISAFISILPTTINGWTSFNYDEGICGIDFIKSLDYLIFGLTYNLVIPSHFIIIFNAIILRSTSKLKKVGTSNKSQSKITSSNQKKDVSKQAGDAGSKVIASILLVVGVFFTCMIPFAFTKAVKVLNIPMYRNMPSWFILFGSFFQFLSSSINPFIYAILRKDYRSAFQKLPRYINDIFMRK